MSFSTIPVAVYIIHNDILQVNNNGDISFTARVSQFTPESFPLSGDLALIAPYWADVDTTGTGTVWYRETADAELLARARNTIQSAFNNQDSFSPTYIFIATWDHVGYYNSHTDKVFYILILLQNAIISCTLLSPADKYIPVCDGYRWSECFCYLPLC